MSSCTSAVVYGALSIDCCADCGMGSLPSCCTFRGPILSYEFYGHIRRNVEKPWQQMLSYIRSDPLLCCSSTLSTAMCSHVQPNKLRALKEL